MFEHLSPLFRETAKPAQRVRFANPIIENAVQAIADLTQAPDMIALQSVLSVLSVATQGLANVQTLGGTAPLSLYLLTIGKSGERKSACDTLASRKIVEYQDRQLVKYMRKQAAYEANLKSDFTPVVDDGADCASASKTSEQPINPTILFGDVTYEAILEHFTYGNPSIGLKSDDGGQFFGGHSMKRDNKLKTAAGLSRLWDGAPIDRHRAGSGSNTFTGRRVCSHFMVQPQVANDVLMDPMLVDQGLLSRFLVAFPDSRIGYRTIDDPKKRQQEVAAAQEMLVSFEKGVQALLNFPLPTSPHDPKSLRPRVLSLSEGAEKILTDFYNRVECSLRPKAQFEHIDGFASKIAEQACRIAGILTLFENPEADCVELVSMMNAIELAEWYLQEMCRLRQCGIVSPEMRDAERLRKWLDQNRAGQLVTTRDITRNGPRPSFSAETARQLMEILCTHDCVELQRRNTVVDGRKAKWSWRVLS